MLMRGRANAAAISQAASQGRHSDISLLLISASIAGSYCAAGLIIFFWG